MEIREERQVSPVEDPVSALVAVTRPIINSVVQSIATEYLTPFESRADVPLNMLGKLRGIGDGDIGVAFEYAIHEAVQRTDPVIVERISAALRLCNIKGGDPSSILFAIEKQGSKQLIGTDIELITENSRALSGKRGQPVKLKKYLNQLAAAFRRSSTRLNLPQSIRGLWKADLFLGSTEPDHWVGTSVKIRRDRLEAAPGLRIAIVPDRTGRADAIERDDSKNLVICPVPHDESFMQVFYEGWRLVQSLCAANFKMPQPVAVHTPVLREVAKVYIDRRRFTVGEVLAETAHYAQPHLLETTTESVASTSFESGAQPGTATVVGPFPMQARLFDS